MGLGLVAVVGLALGYALGWTRTSVILQVAIAATVIAQLLEAANTVLSSTVSRLTFVPLAAGLVLIATLWAGAKLRARATSRSG
ncbi:MAG TPA: hypothetical protein VF234_07795 [Limnochordia bacterium]